MTAYGTVRVLAFGVPSAFIITVAVRALCRRARGRRRDREWAADLGRRVRARRNPGLPCDGRPLTPHEEHLLGEIVMDSFIDVPEPAYGPDRGDAA